MRNSRVPQRWVAMLAVLLLAACQPKPQAFDGARAMEWVIRQCDLGYRITGTQANLAAGDMILEELDSLGWQTTEQTFIYRDTPVRNLLAWRGEGPAVMLGAHYDTRRSADMEDSSVPVLGANDGASGVAVLLELARVLDWSRIDNTVYLAFFDAEDNGNLDGWDWIVGSSYMAAHWGEQGEPPLEAVIVIDMIGDADLQVYYERHSDRQLSEQIWGIAGRLGYGNRIIPEYRYAIIDDHLPFLQRGFPAIVMIDFDYPYWHTTQDTPDKVSPESLAVIGHTLKEWLEAGP